MLIQNMAKEKKIALSFRLFMYVLIGVLAFLYSLTQENFLNWSLLKSFYSVAIFGIAINLYLILSAPRYSHKFILVFSFVFDVLCLSILLYESELNQSLFLFLDLLVIVVCALHFYTYGALLVAASFSLLTTFILILGPELKTLSYLFLLVLNNFAYFSVAFLSGYLASQLSEQGQRILFLREIYESVVSLLPSGVLSFDTSGKILHANEAASLLLHKKNLTDENLSEILPWRDFLKRKKQEKFSFLYKQNNQSHDFEIQWFEQNLEETKAYMLLLEDHTELRKLQFAIQQSEKLAAVGQLAAGIAHEIRNPLAGISGSIELLNEQNGNEEQRKLYKIILKEIARLNNLVGDFLDFAKPWQAPHEKNDLSKILNETLDLATRDKVKTPRLEIVNQIQSNLFIVSNSERLKQAFLNMLINSLQAMESTEKQILTLSAEKNEHEVIVQIIDTGIGMNEQQRQRMFEPFHTTKVKGTGLGLAITHKILQLHRSSIYVESEPGVGTQILIRFPIQWV